MSWATVGHTISVTGARDGLPPSPPMTTPLCPPVATGLEPPPPPDTATPSCSTPPTLVAEQPVAETSASVAAMTAVGALRVNPERPPGGFDIHLAFANCGPRLASFVTVAPTFVNTSRRGD